VSLILEALRKLDREKQAPDRGLVVVGPAAWPTAHGRSPLTGTAAAVLAVLAVGVLAGLVWLFRGGQADKPAAAIPAASAPVPTGVAETRPAPPAPAPVAAPVKPGSPVKAAPAPGARRASAAEPVREAAGAEEGPPSATGRIAEPKPAPGTVSLQAISAQNGQPIAILNDHLVREGDSFDGIRVVRIGADEVEIEVAGRRRVVKF